MIHTITLVIQGCTLALLLDAVVNLLRAERNMRSYRRTVSEIEEARRRRRRWDDQA